MTTFNISIVAHGTVYESDPEKDQYALAVEEGKFVEISSESQLSTREIVRRILSNKDNFEKKFAKKTAAEKKYYEHQKTFVEEL